MADQQTATLETSMPALEFPGAHPIQVMATGYMVARSIYVVAKLGIADLLADGPRTVEELAAATDTHSRSLYRLMRCLVGEGVFREDEGGRFSLTQLSEALRSHDPKSVRGYVLFHHELVFPSWVEVMHSVCTGEPAFNTVFEHSLFEYFEANPEVGQRFQTAMKEAQRYQDPDLAAVFDFSDFQRVVDVGGGSGSLLSAILTRYDHLSGVLLDREGAVAEAKAGVGAVLPRCEFEVGDFFAEVPSGGDVYTLKRKSLCRCPR